MFFLEFGVRLVFWVSKLWVSDSSKVVSVVSKDLQEVLQSNFDELPRSLKHLSKITRSEEFTNSVVRVSQALTDGILRGYGIENKSEIEEVGGLNFVDKVMDRMMVARSSVIRALYSKISGLEVFCRIKLADRSIVEFFTLKLSENMKRSVDIVHEEVVERGLDVITQINAKSYIPESFNKARNVIRDLGLDYEKLHACPNDCSYSGRTMRKLRFALYVGLLDGRLLVVPQPMQALKFLQRNLRHPTDGEAWKDFDHLYPDFSRDPRNIRLGLSSDGFNPFRTMSISHSTWPVMLMNYNLSPWICMKPEYLMLSMIIPGPFSPGNNIDVYFQPLLD
ncbi:putative agamous-like MADS-box protein AGL92-like [Capsicum annuum]|nr:putative agamous-like MADS-box protein AGL92-like [Capsicum annuum]